MDHRVASAPGDRVVAGALVAAQLALVSVLLAPAPAPAPGPRRRQVSRARRALGVLLLGSGGSLALAGALALGPALTPSPLPAASAQLRTDGLYGRLRHPIYTGLVLAATGRALSSGAPRHRAAAVALGGLFTCKARFEEQRLTERFPAYRDYARRTPALGEPARRGGDR